MLNGKTKEIIIMDQAEFAIPSSERLGPAAALPVGSCTGPHLNEAV